MNRRRNGYSLGLIASCAVVLIAIGIACYFLAKIMGGGREVGNVTDAGTLNVAKQSIKSPTVPSVATLFDMCADPPGSGISLLTYNRCVAQAMLIALNAKQEGTPQAGKNAKAVFDELETVAGDLQGRLSNPGNLSPSFDDIARANRTNMFGNNGVKVVDTKIAFMKPGYSTNIYFQPNEFPVPPPSGMDTAGTLKPSAPGASPYMAGYKKITIDVPDGSLDFYGVPVFPQQPPHLVSTKDFDASAAAPIDKLPPNAFKIGSQSLDSKSTNYGGAVACAIVGAVKSNNANSDYLAAIPGGYIEINNADGEPLPDGFAGSDNSDNIFNNDLYLGPGIDATDTGGTGLFSEDIGQIQAWASYNASTGPDPNGHDPALLPSAKGFTGDVYVVTSPGAKGTKAALSDLLKIKDSFDCLALLNGPGLSGPCLTYLKSFEATFKPGPGGLSPGDTNKIYSKVDYVKGQLIAAFESGDMSPTIGSPTGKSGLGKYPFGPYESTPSPQITMPIQKTGTIMELLNQVGNCANTTTVDGIVQRCMEIQPKASKAKILTLLDTPIPMGSTLYIYLPDGDQNKDLVISATRPKSFGNVNPDGVDGSSNPCNSNTYPLVGTLVNTTPGNGFKQGDDILMGEPYEKVAGDTLMGVDRADWTLSSGFGNLLGQLHFSNQVLGQAKFSRPN